MTSRPLALQGSFNFRDLGGLEAGDGRRIRHGRVFRSDALHRLTDDDVTRLERFGIETVFDLRSRPELEKDGVGPFVESVRHLHMPLVEITLSPFDPDIDWMSLNLHDRYMDMLRGGGETVRAVLELLAAPSAAPLVFHCTGGKDRTGVVAAVLLRLLGVPDDVVIADYATSQEYLRGFIEGYREMLTDQGLDAEAVAYLTSSPPERMRYTLDELDRRWGSTEAYVGEHGIDDDVIERLRRNLLGG